MMIRKLSSTRMRCRNNVQKKQRQNDELQQPIAGGEVIESIDLKTLEAQAWKLLDRKRTFKTKSRIFENY